MSRRLFQAGYHSITGESVSWAGYCPWTKSTCLGTESGGFGIVRPARRANHGQRIAAIPAVTDAVNGAAFLAGHVAISSRNEVRIFKPAEKPGRLSPNYFEFPGGGHGVVAAPAVGEFVAPLGGPRFVRLLPLGTRCRAIVGRMDRPDVYFYRMVRIGPSGAEDLVAVAGRRGGVASFPIGETASGFVASIHDLGGADIIDVASAKEPSLPRAVVALAADGTLFFFPDVFSDAHPPVALAPTGPIGTAYSILVVKGNGLILTDERVACLPGLVGSVRGGHKPVESFGYRVEAAEMLPGEAGYFILLEGGDAAEYQIDAFIESARSSRGATRTQARSARDIRAFHANVEPNDYEPAVAHWDRAVASWDRQESEELIVAGQ